MSKVSLVVETKDGVARLCAGMASMGASVDIPDGASNEEVAVALRGLADAITTRPASETTQEAAVSMHDLVKLVIHFDPANPDDDIFPEIDSREGRHKLVRGEECEVSRYVLLAIITSTKTVRLPRCCNCPNCPVGNSDRYAIRARYPVSVTRDSEAGIKWMRALVAETYT